MNLHAPELRNQPAASAPELHNHPANQPGARINPLLLEIVGGLTGTPASDSSQRGTTCGRQPEGAESTTMRTEQRTQAAM